MSVLACLKGYITDRSASMATQVVMFSVLLFGTSGVVLDFGRVYSEHSIMQSYTDQAALAAAAELDRRSGSIDRAVDAVFGGLDNDGNAMAAPLSRDAVFSSGETAGFGVSHLIFLSDMGDDSGSQTSMAGITDDIVYVAFADGSESGVRSNAESQAKYVIAVAEERSVRNTLIQLINSGTESPSAASNVVRTVSAATREHQFCGEFSNLVMCSRKADMTDDLPSRKSYSDLGEFMNEFTGVRFAHIADNDGGTENYRLYRRTDVTLQSPDSVHAICDDDTLRPGALTGSLDKQDTYRALCHLASTTPRDHCVGEKITIVQAEPEVITTALSTAFDMYDYPLNEILNLPGTANEAAMVDFQPDLLIYKGQVRSDDATINANLSLGIPTSSRLNYEDAPPPASSYFDLMLPSCLRNPASYGNCAIGSHIGSATNYTALSEYYLSNYFSHFVAFNFPGGLSRSLTTFYMASLEERFDWTHAATDQSYFNPYTGAVSNVAAGQSLVVTGEDASSAASTPDPDQSAHDLASTPSVNENFSNYNSVRFPVDRNSGNDRRRLTVPLVDCSNMVFDAEQGGYQVDVLTFVDVYMLHPPLPTCADGSENCTNDALFRSTLYSEMIEKSDYREAHFPELVR